VSNRRPSPTRRSVRIQTTPRTFPIPSARQSISNRACSTRKSISPYRPLKLNSEFEESSSCSRIPIRFAIRLTEQNSCRTSVYLGPRNPNAPRTIPNFGIWVKALEVAHWMRQPPISRNRPPIESRMEATESRRTFQPLINPELRAALNALFVNHSVNTVASVRAFLLLTVTFSSRYRRPQEISSLLTHWRRFPRHNNSAQHQTQLPILPAAW